MPRRARVAPGGLVYHALNRAVARLPLFQKEGDYAAFVQVMREALQRHPTRLLSFCLMPNHWHMVLWPRAEGELTRFLRWLTHTHTMRWHAHYHSSGSGHLYQGRFKAFPVETDEYFYSVVRYVERNALRAKLVERAEDWRWCSLWLRARGDCDAQSLLHPWPLALPRKWAQLVNTPQTEAEEQALRRSVNRGSPLGSEAWQKRMVRRLGLEYTLRPRGRPKQSKQ
jgi:putative transposase